jgi:pimeloyl-[acyl-carrier protein] methyl ester esterase
MSLYLKTQGKGDDIVLLHGWGMHSDAWEDVVNALVEEYRVTVIDLPGHGRSEMVLDEFELKKIAGLLAKAKSQPAIWIGWSLGGMIAAQIALMFPEQVKGLVLVASSPQFVKDEDWPHAMSAELLLQFAQELEQDYRETVKRFIAIQSMGSAHKRNEMRALRERLFRHGEPDMEALRGGLRILSEVNLRPHIKDIQCKIQFIMGSHDSLVPARAIEDILDNHATVQCHVIQGAGHTPFVSHPDEFIETVKAFLKIC